MIDTLIIGSIVDVLIIHAPMIDDIINVLIIGDIIDVLV